MSFTRIDIKYIDNNTPFHFIFDWGVSYWPRADDKEHNFAWRLHICQRAECLPEGFSPRANTEPEGKCVAWGRNYVLFPWEQGQYETPRSNLKWKGVLLFIVHPYHYFKTIVIGNTALIDSQSLFSSIMPGRALFYSIMPGRALQWKIMPARALYWKIMTGYL